LIGGEALRARDLRNDFVAAALNAEAIDIIAPQHCTEIEADLLQIQTKRRDFVAVKDDFRLRLVKLQIGISKHEHPTLEGFPNQLIGKFEEFLRLCSGRDDKLNRELST